jgi:hypothetical protein
MFNRIVEPEYCEMRKNIVAQVASGRLTEHSDLSKVLDSLEVVELTMEVEESGVEPAVEIKTVRDFLWLCRAMDFQRQRRGHKS